MFVVCLPAGRGVRRPCARRRRRAPAGRRLVGASASRSRGRPYARATPSSRLGEDDVDPVPAGHIGSRRREAAGASTKVEGGRFRVAASRSWEDEGEPQPLRRRARERAGRLPWRAARIAAGEPMGGAVYELQPGERTFPYHYEYGGEEWLVVVAGRPTLRDPEGERELRAGRRRLLPRGPGGRAPGQRHGRPVRVLIVSTSTGPASRSTRTATSSARARPPTRRIPTGSIPARQRGRLLGGRVGLEREPVEATRSISTYVAAPTSRRRPRARFPRVLHRHPVDQRPRSRRRRAGRRRGRGVSPGGTGSYHRGPTSRRAGRARAFVFVASSG